MKPYLDLILDRELLVLRNFTQGVIVFDRDDTIVEDAGQHNNPSKIFILPNALKALKLLKSLDYGIAIASNQSGLESGKFELLDLERFNRELKRILLTQHGIQIDLIAICPHVAASNCRCRKPRTGLLQAIDQAGIGTLKLFVGNSQSDKNSAEIYGIGYLDVNSDNFFSDLLEWTRN